MTLYSERIVWTPAYAISAVLAAIGAVQLFDDWILGLVLLGTALLLVWFSTARYTVTTDELSVGIGGGNHGCGSQRTRSGRSSRRASPWSPASDTEAAGCC